MVSYESSHTIADVYNPTAFDLFFLWRHYAESSSKIQNIFIRILLEPGTVPVTGTKTFYKIPVSWKSFHSQMFDCVTVSAKTLTDEHLFVASLVILTHAQWWSVVTLALHKVVLFNIMLFNLILLVACNYNIWVYYFKKLQSSSWVWTALTFFDWLHQ